MYENEKLFNIEFDKILNEKYSFIKHLNLNDKISYKSLNENNYKSITFISKKELIDNGIIEFNSYEFNSYQLNEIKFIKKGIHKLYLSRNYNYLIKLNDMEIIKYIVNIN
jgi:hypothetical protein